MADNTPGYAAARDQLTQIASRLQQMADSAVPPAGLNGLVTLTPSTFNSGAATGAQVGAGGAAVDMAGVPSAGLRDTLAAIGVGSPTFIKGMVGSMDWNQQLINRSLDQVEQIEQEYSAAIRRAGSDQQAQQQATQAMQRKLGAIANQIPRSARSLAGPS